MAIDALRYPSSKKRASTRTVKERREKIVLGVGLAILLLVLGLEGPKTLERLTGPSTGSTLPGASALPTPRSRGSSIAPRTPSLRVIDGFPAKDPFAPQLGATAGGSAPSIHVVPPAVRASDFVAKDPFVQQLTAGSSAPPHGLPMAGGERTGGVGAGGSYIVMVASIAISSGRAAAEATAAAARARGIASVRIVVSSDYPTLRAGYYAVYSGSYSTLAAALAALQRVRAHGYVSAYTRRLAH